MRLCLFVVPMRLQGDIHGVDENVSFASPRGWIPQGQKQAENQPCVPVSNLSIARRLVYRNNKIPHIRWSHSEIQYRTSRKPSSQNARNGIWQRYDADDAVWAEIDCCEISKAAVV